MTINLKLNALLFHKYATKLNLPVYLKSGISGFYIQLGTKRYFFRDLYHPFNNQSSMSIVNNRYCLNNLLSSARLPVFKMYTISKDDLQSPENLKKILTDLPFPINIGPTVINRDNVIQDTKVTTLLELQNTAQLMFRDHQWLSIQEATAYPNSYNILVFNNKIIAISQISQPPVKTNISEHNSDLLLRAAKILDLNLVSFRIDCVNLEKTLATSGIITSIDPCPNLMMYNSKSDRTMLDKIINKMLTQLAFKHPVAYLINIVKSFFNFKTSHHEKITQKTI